jgi:hypothetical protein
VTLSGNSLTVHEVFTGLSAPATAAHIHCCAAPGTAAPVQVPCTGFRNTTAGIYDAAFDLSTITFTPGVTEPALSRILRMGSLTPTFTPEFAGR